jgi:hypothetical protein
VPPSARSMQCHHLCVPTPRTSACALAHLQPATPQRRHQQAQSVPAAPSAPTAPASSSTKIELEHSFAWLHSSVQGRRSGVFFCPAPPQRRHLLQGLHRASTAAAASSSALFARAPQSQRHRSSAIHLRGLRSASTVAAASSTFSSFSTCSFHGLQKPTAPAAL